jgi:putative ABC transport system permease protein
MLGIIIGIASVIVLMSIGASAQDLILSQVKSIGSNLVFVIPGSTKGSRFQSPPSVQGIIIKTLVKEDLDAFLREPSILSATAEVRGQAKAVFENNDTTATFSGTTETYFSVREFKVERGQPFYQEDVVGLNHVAVLGTKMATTLFGDKDPIGKNFRFKNLSLRVVGILEKKGMGPGGVDQDNLVLIPITVAQKQLLGIDYYNFVTVQANPEYNLEFVKSRMISVLRQNHRITDPDKDDFTIQTLDDAVAILGTITGVMTLFLTAIAMISLLVGGIGIMNIMLVSVIERTKEIGLRKAVGATRTDIIRQFLVEAIILTLLGGIIGIALGALVVIALYYILVTFSTTGWTFNLPPSAIILAFAVSSLTGVVFGIYPAYKASQKSPIEALRYE